MTATIDDTTADLDRPLDTPSGTSPGRRPARTVPPGSEPMARPWRLGLIGAGIAAGLIGRLVIANGIGDLRSNTAVLVAAVASALAAAGLLAIAAERDRFGAPTAVLAIVTAASLGVVQWVAPHFPSGTLEWEPSTQFALVALGAANGALLAGVVTVAFVRRHPTASVVAAIASSVLVLAAGSVLLRNEWPAILVLAVAFGLLLLAWDRAPRHEVRYTAGVEPPRTSRAALGLASMLLSGAAIQLWLSRDEGGPAEAAAPAATSSAVVIALALVAVALMGLLRVRREIQRRETTLSEWASWMREIRTRDLQSDFDGFADSEGVGDLTGDVPALSFPDLRVPDPPDDLAGDAAMSVEQPPLFGGGPPASFEQLWAETQRDAEADAAIDAIVSPEQSSLFDDTDDWGARHDPTWTDSTWADSTRQDPTWADPIWADAPDLGRDDDAGWNDQPSPSDDAAAPAPEATDHGWVEPPGIEQPRWADDAEWLEPATTLPEPLWADAVEPAVEPAPAATADAGGDAAVDATVAPTSSTEFEPADEAPVIVSLRDARRRRPTPTGEAEPTGAFASLSGRRRDAAPPTAAPGAFSTVVSQASSSLATTGDLERWLDTTASRPHRLLLAIEAMSLADYDELPPEVSRAAVEALAARLGRLGLAPDLVTSIDGPYLIAGWPEASLDDVRSLNHAVLAALVSPVDTPHGAVGLSATVAFLQIGPSATVTTAVDESIIGLTVAHRAALAARSD